MNDGLQARHTIHATHGHFNWNRANPPVLTIAPGDLVEFDTIDASGGQIGPGSTAEAVLGLDFTRVNPVTGPVFVDGAEPGDVLEIEVLSLRPSGWGWTAVIPGFGLLADQFREPALHVWRYAPDLTPAAFGPGGRVPLKPFAGTIGLAPGEPGEHSVVPPRRVGGNLDVRDLSEGAVLYLPVEVPGGLLSVGDGHAAQGDGEVCGTAIETPLGVALRIGLRKGETLRFPRFTTPGPVTRHLDGKGYEVTTGVGPDLLAAARDATGAMVDRLATRAGLRPVDAYMLCSVCADLRVLEVVDVPNWVVGLYFPRIVLE